jgi:hypothetical protein
VLLWEEELLKSNFNRISTGALSDLEKVTNKRERWLPSGLNDKK